MTWWQAGALAVGLIAIIASAIVGVLGAAWRRQERRDGLR